MIENNLLLTSAIHDVLNDVGIKSKWMGWYFTTRIVVILYESSENLMISKLYRKFAKEFNYGATADSIERNVRYCFEHLNYDSPEAKRIFGLAEGKNSISIKRGLYAILDEVRLRIK